MAWGSSAIQIGDELFIYYGGYARGHKVEPAKERQIGLAKLPGDRYVSRDAGTNGGTLLTPPFAPNGRRLIVNADIRGQMRVRLLRANGKPVPGYDWDDCTPVKGDSLSHEASWRGAREKLPTSVVSLEFKLVNAELYGFDMK
jgi:hypothetical protein